MTSHLEGGKTGDDAEPAAGELQTFIFADLAGYTALTEAHGDERAADAAAEFCASVRPLLAEYDADEVKAVGDALLLRVAEGASAVHLAARIVSDYGHRHQSLGVRIGMHTGTAVLREGDWFGSAVNLASRVSDVARAGEVVMTAATREAARIALVETKVRSRGRRRFKNVFEPMEVFSLQLGETDRVRRLPIDPVCRMAVDPDQATAQAVHDGVEYHFCSAGCAQAFNRNPLGYTRRSGHRAELLVSESARERTAERLARAFRKGRLDLGELEERVEQVVSARTRGDLELATHGLLPPGRSRPWPVLFARWLTRPARRLARRLADRRRARQLDKP